MPTLACGLSVECMLRTSFKWRLVVSVGLAVQSLAMAGCWPFSSSDSNQGAPTPAVTQAATPPATGAASPTPAASGDYCAELIRVNTENGTMVAKNQISVDKWTPAQVKAIVDFTVAHSAEILAISPQEIKAAMTVDLQWWQAVKDANYNMSAAKVPPGFSDAVAQISTYQHNVCGINFG